MSLKEIDFLSPKITLYYYGSKRHKSIVGAIISLIMVFLSSVYIFYLFFSVINHKISNFMSNKTYLTEAGHYIFNDTTGIYHYFQVYDIVKKEYGEYDPKYMRIFMSRLYKTYQSNQASLSENEHWVYDKCRDGEDNKNVNKDVFGEETYFYKGACLRYYYNNEIKEYIPIEDKNNFKYPYLIHGSGRPGSLFLETIIEKCDNSSITHKILGPCGPKNELNDYINNYLGIFLQLLEKQVITKNYGNPIYEYISGISGALNSLIVPINNINIAPLHIEIKRGVFVPRTQKIITYNLENNRRDTWENNGNKNILCIFDYWLQNSCQEIKGGYSTLYDILPSIGGIIQLIYYIFYCINYVYNKYIIIQDSNKSFFRNYNSEDKQNTKTKKKFLKFINSIREESQKIYKKDIFKRESIYMPNKDKKDIKSLNLNIEMTKNKKNKSKKIKTEINSSKKLSNELKHNNNINEFSNSNDLMISLPNNAMHNNVNNIPLYNKKQNLSILKDKIKNNENGSNKKEDLKSFCFHESDKINSIYFQFSHQLQEFINHKRKTFKTEILNEKIISKYITFFNYCMTFSGNEYKKRGFEVLNKFRQKLLGEEHLFRTNIFLYHIEKYFNIKERDKIDIYELYENL